MDWGVSTRGWNNYQDARGLGSNGAWPWGTRPAIDTSAEWIWSADAHNHIRLILRQAFRPLLCQSPVLYF